MSIARERRMGRRDFLLTTAIGSLALSFGVAPAAAEDEKNTHNMLVFGEQAIFLSHLPMFHGLGQDGTEFMSPHRYQVGRRLARAQKMIAEGATLSDAAAATGFADQSHLTRHFSARFGLTPGRWATLARQS